METFRGFIAVDVPISKEMIHFKNDLEATTARLKLVKPENMHITLKFLGDTPVTQIDAIASIMKTAVKTITPHTIQVIGTGVFPNTNYIKVIWMGLKQADHISNVSQILNTDLTQYGFKKEKRGFSAHLTLARMKSSQGKDEVLSIVEKYRTTLFTEISIQQIALKKSTLTPQGPIYETITTVPIH